MAKDLDKRLEQVGFAGAVFADEHIDKAATIEAQGKIPKVFVLADMERYQAHGISLYLRHHGVEKFGLFAGGGLNLLLQSVAETHQLVDTGDNAVLFREGGEGKFPQQDVISANPWNSYANR
jgi:hypothetical protein